jgi:16S rRNA (cytosine1402-N4)-methyltransferase
MLNSVFHTPVMLEEVIEYLQIKKGEKYVDCTLGGGGHSGRIRELGGKLLSIDQDSEAISHVWEKFKAQRSKFKIPDQNSKVDKIYEIDENWELVQGNFADIEELAKVTGFEKVSGVLFDLGVSSHQFEDKSRGFSFDSNEELDMRMDKNLGVKASALVNGLTRKELEKMFLELGDEENGWKIAREIEKVREVLPIRTCRQLSEICERVCPRVGRLHPATKVFQALRIQINDELGSLEKGLREAFSILKPGGRIVVISFHSLEDRVAKQYFRALEEEKKIKVLTNKPVMASENEEEENPRSRSAKLRAIEKI